MHGRSIGKDQLVVPCANDWRIRRNHVMRRVANLLLAGALSMSAAMGSTGLAQWLSDIIHPLAHGHAW